MIGKGDKGMLHDFRNTVQPAGYYLDTAKKAQEEKDFSYARRLLREGTKKHPKDARLWQELGKSLRTIADWDDETLRCFARAHELDRQSPHIAMEYAGFLTRKNQYDKAEVIYMSLLAGEGETPRLFLALGNHYQTRKKYPLAAAAFTRACDLKPDNESGQRRLKEVVGLLGRECTDEDRRKLSFRIVKMTEAWTEAKAPHHGLHAR